MAEPTHYVISAHILHELTTTAICNSGSFGAALAAQADATAVPLRPSRIVTPFGDVPCWVAADVPPETTP